MRPNSDEELRKKGLRPGDGIFKAKKPGIDDQSDQSSGLSDEIQELAKDAPPEVRRLLERLDSIGKEHADCDCGACEAKRAGIEYALVEADELGCDGFMQVGVRILVRSEDEQATRERMPEILSAIIGAKKAAGYVTPADMDVLVAFEGREIVEKAFNAAKGGKPDELIGLLYKHGMIKKKEDGDGEEN